MKGHKDHRFYEHTRYDASHVDTSLYGSARTAKQQAKANRKIVHMNGKLDDEHQANRTHRKTVNILKLGDTKAQIKALRDGPYWHSVIETICKQRVRDKLEVVARIERRL